jgi:hypothetical protein
MGKAVLVAGWKRAILNKRSPLQEIIDKEV